MRVLRRQSWARDSTKNRTTHTAEQIIRKLKTVADVGRVIKVMQPTCHHCRQQYGVHAGSDEPFGLELPALAPGGMQWTAVAARNINHP